LEIPHTVVFLCVSLIVTQWARDVVSVKMFLKTMSSDDKTAVLHVVFIFTRLPERPKISPCSSRSFSFCLFREWNKVSY